ncbi:MAG: ABC transporter ATP-binding protein [Candidatus Eisenbacteria bacterium]|uniref:ABC transporter ATP-binding protein n=1 Tax=Eiseniibacteriota bacterium TaxID=2212470 RepID=A0A7Y2E7N5_UNCEI|nr:ABC transporter ATP-binding protein [Candidatus Eisenbacteria bacterium]
MIRVENLKKNYAAFPAVKGVSFEVAPGEIVGFLGPNGAGKTTTLRILSGYMPASGGTAEISGKDVFRDSREVRRQTGYLPEDVPLYRDMTVTAYLRFLAGLKEVPKGQLGSEIDRVIGLTGLEPVAKRLVGKCSKGYRQRTGLAQALLGDPPVLLMDEPTSGLDPNQVAEVRELIRTLSGEKTVLLSSHILSEVSQICARVLIINNGELVASGSPDTLARELGTGEVLYLRVGESIQFKELEGVAGVERMEPVSANACRLNVTDPEETAPRVARWLVDRNVDLLELRPEKADLEAVFRRLTGEKNHA